jgi:hypothetical protein
MIVKPRKSKLSKYLVADNEYIVFSLYFANRIEIMVQAESLPSAPYRVDIDDVDVIDNRLSRYWLYGESILRTAETAGRPPMLSFPEWINDIYFFENIVNSVGEAGSVWRKYREKMELEFAPPSLKRTAIVLKDNWVQCEVCAEAWQANADDEVAVCPSCLTRQRRW